jgi:hypothetical protein
VDLIEQLEFAKRNAARSFSAALANATDNPSTRVHELVEFLEDIKSEKNNNPADPAGDLLVTYNRTGRGEIL